MPLQQRRLKTLENKKVLELPEIILFEDLRESPTRFYRDNTMVENELTEKAFLALKNDVTKKVTVFVIEYSHETPFS